MSRFPARLFLLASLFTALTACSGAGGSTSQSPPGGHACPALAEARTASLVAPANGATGVPTTIGSVTATSDTGLAGATVNLTPSGGTPVAGGIFATASSTAVSASVPVLSAHTTYTVGANVAEPTGDGCFLLIVWTIGSFTTQ